MIAVIFAGVILLCVVTWFLVVYMDPELSSISVRIIVFLALVASGSIVVLIPFDLELSNYNDCINEHPTHPEKCVTPSLNIPLSALSLTWKLIYWITFFLVWVFMPFVTNFSRAAEFKLSERIVTAIKTSLRFYLILGSLSLSGIIYLFISVGISFNGIVSLCMSLANLWGLILLVLLCGHGLVNFPRSLWRKSNYEREVKFAEFSASAVYSDLEQSKNKLSETLSKVTKVATQVPPRNPLYHYLSKVISKCPLSAYQNSTSLLNIGKGNGLGGADISYELVCSLHKEVIMRTSSLRIHEARWMNLVKKYSTLKTLLSVKRQRQEVGRKPLVSGNQGAVKRSIWIEIRPWFFKFLSIVLSLFSGLLLFSEISLVSDYITSPISLFMEAVDSAIIHSVLIMMPVGYMLMCGFYSLANVRKGKDYAVLKKLTAPWSGIFLSGFMLRIVFPLCYNFLNILKVDNTAFIAMFGPMRDLPLLGVTLNTWLPVAIVGTCFLVFFECFSSVLRVFGVNTFNHDEVNEDPNLLVEGRALLMRAKDLLAREEGRHDIVNICV
ncbi:hypothetical protein GEMRC1_004053 [Eukaryota sp. GEM-RC1]